MKLLLVSEEPRIRGGIPRYTVPVAEALARRGHDVHYLAPGGYAELYDWRLRRRFATRREHGITYHTLWNARSIGVNVGMPALDVTCDDSRWIIDRAAGLQPDVVHVHSFLGLPVETLEGLGRLAPTVVSVHDFGLLCQQRVLVQVDGNTCTTYRTQADCPNCVVMLNPARFRMRARLARTAGGLPLRALQAGERVSGVDVSVTEEHRGNGAVRPYQERLERSVALVNSHAARVLAVSRSVRDILLEVGVDPQLVEVMHIGSNSAERLPRLPLPSEKGAPVTFAFIGGLVPNKGVHVLVAALAGLADPPRVLVAGRGNAGYEAELRRAAPACVEFRGPYTPEGLVALLADCDVVVAPAVGPDTSPQVVLEALAAGRPVVGSRTGGIPDFVEDGVNGRLVEPGDEAELARALVELSDPAHVVALAHHAGLPRTVDEHVNDLETLYARVA